MNLEIFLVIILCFIVSYVVSYLLMIDKNSVYANIYDYNEHVKVVEKNLLFTTIAHTDASPETIFTLKFIFFYTRI